MDCKRVMWLATICLTFVAPSPPYAQVSADDANKSNNPAASFNK